MKLVKERGMTQLRSDQRSGEVQYEHASFLIGTPDSSETIGVSIGYRRSLDFDAKNSAGQDYAAVQGDDNGYVVGIVADGVSESFYGDLAAYHLSDWLLDTLWDERESPPSEDKLERKLKGLEATIAAEYVENYPIPDDLAPLHKESLEEKRSKGSQTVFAAFVLNASRKRLHLYQVGDVDAIVHYPDRRPDPVEAPPKGRWSSAGKSEMRLQLATYEGYEYASGIVIKSDGAGKEWGFRGTVFTRSTFEFMSEKRAGMDDVSFVAARWGNWQEGPETELDRPLLETQVSRSHRETEVLPDMKRYDPNSYPRTPLPGTGRNVPDYASPRGVRGGRGRVMPDSPGTRVWRRRHLRPGGVPLFASVIVSCFLIISLLVVIAIIVLPDNIPPEAKDDTYNMNITQGVLVVPPPGVLRNDRDEDEEDRKNLQVKVIRDPSNGRVDLDPNGKVSYWPKPGFNGNDSFVYSAVDTHGQQDTAKATITVRAPNSVWQRLRDLFGGRQ